MGGSRELGNVDAMMRITEVTRRNIVDALIASGISWAGRLGDAEFLGRLFDLEQLPSNDRRHPTMSGDIWQHRVNNADDWPENWALTDDRINLSCCSDELFLRFLAETLHPIVRSDCHEVKRLHALYNQHLGADGVSLHEVGSISGRPIFEGRLIAPEANAVNYPAGYRSRTRLPVPLIHILSEAVGNWYYSHAKINKAFTRAGAPGQPPDGNCVDKCRDWFARINADLAIDPLTVIGNLLAEFMSKEADGGQSWRATRDAVVLGLRTHGLAYDPSGQIVPFTLAPPPGVPPSTQPETLKKAEGATRQTPSQKRFDVALSFPGAHRTLVAAVAEQLLGKGLQQDRVFYDVWYQHELARPNLDTHLQSIYSSHTRLVVVFVCAEYQAKEWPGLEWRAIRAMIKSRRDEEIMPFRLDNADVDGLLTIDGYIPAEALSASDIAEEIMKRLHTLPAQ